MFEKKGPSELSKQVYDKLVPEDHFFYKVNKLVDFSFVNDLCKDLYSRDMGRPAYPPEQIFRGAIAQFYFDLSDRKMEQEITFNIAAKWFIGLEIDDRSFDHSTISKFRTTLGKMTPRKLDSKQYTTTARAHRTAGRLLSGAERASRTKNLPSRRPVHPG